VDKPRRDWTAAEHRQHTENARRLARLKFARARIERIRDGNPPFTDDELADLAELLAPASETG
jgi:hypothetical protein